MKIKETKNGNIKITFSSGELRVIMSVLQHVCLGTGENSDVIFDLQEKLSQMNNQYLLENLDDISVLTEIHDGVVSHTISV